MGRAAKLHAGAPCLQDLPQAVTQDAPLQGVCIFLGKLFDFCSEWRLCRVSPRRRPEGRLHACSDPS